MTRSIALLGTLGLFCTAAMVEAAGPATTTGRYVTVWYLEIQYRPMDAWAVAGKYSSYADAQQSYTVRARHGGYHRMRIRQTQEWRSDLRTTLRRKTWTPPNTSILPR